MKAIILSMALLFSVSSFARVPEKPAPAVVAKAAEALKKEIRTITRSVMNKDGNPCMPQGKSWNVDLQVKHSDFDRENNKWVVSWETVKTINVSKEGDVMESCQE
jgi:hypothetical protein